MASSIYDLLGSRGPQFVGVLTYTDAEDGGKKELKTDQFWSGSYIPSQQQMSIYLKIKGVNAPTSMSYCRVM
mgnify:CR=1 FL=1